MSWNHCTITGEPLEEPVISKLTGHIFEKRVISKHIESLGTCPITGQPMTVQDIIAIQVNKTIRPRNIIATSIPQLLNIFQSEWDSLLTETLNLKQQLKVIRQELSHALYQHDAACRVIARLIRERDAARGELARLQERARQTDQQEEIEVEKEPSLGQQLASEITEKALQLNSERKEIRRGGFQGYSTQEQISNFSQKLSLKLHEKEKGGINCISLNPSNERCIATGATDGGSLLYDIEEKKTLCHFTQHKQRINDVVFLSSVDKLQAITCSEDNSGYLYSVEENEAIVKYEINQHSRALTEMSLHPLNRLLVVASRDGSWSFHDIAIGKLLNKVDQWEKNLEFESIEFHPDGHILAAGCSDGTLKLWNLTEDSLSSSLDVANACCDLIAFSQNGYQLATCSKATSIVKIWDLRNLTNTMTFFESDSNENQKNLTSSLAFDSTGQFLAVGRENGINLYSCKNWEKMMRFEGYEESVADIQFSSYSRSIVAASHDGQLCLYS